jgi:hypothetical protein
MQGRKVWGPIVQGLDRTYNCEDDTRSLATALFASSILVHVIPVLGWPWQTSILIYRPFINKETVLRDIISFRVYKNQ